MVQLIKDNLESVGALCDKYGIEKMFVFGSAANGQHFSASSDIDLLYKLRPEILAQDVFDRPDFFDMLFNFEALFGRKVDLIDLTRVQNPYFIQSVNLNKQKIYGA